MLMKKINSGAAANGEKVAAGLLAVDCLNCISSAVRSTCAQWRNA